LAQWLAAPAVALLDGATLGVPDLPPRGPRDGQGVRRYPVEIAPLVPCARALAVPTALPMILSVTLLPRGPVRPLKGRPLEGSARCLDGDQRASRLLLEMLRVTAEVGSKKAYDTGARSISSKHLTHKMGLHVKGPWMDELLSLEERRWRFVRGSG